MYIKIFKCVSLILKLQQCLNLIFFKVSGIVFSGCYMKIVKCILVKT